MRNKILTLLIAVIFGLGTFYSFLAWMSNFIFSYPQWSILKFNPIADVCISAQNISVMQQFQTYEITTVDLSSITTFLLVLTFGIPFMRILICSREIYKAKELRVSSIKNFPYWKGYETLFVQLGLIGTLFGLIIAFKQDQQNIIAGNVELILLALSTALWSTFMAVVLVFVICPYFILKPFQYAFPSFFPVDVEETQDLVVDIAYSFKILKDQVAEAQKQLQGFNDNTKIVTGAVNDLTTKISEVVKSMEDANKELSTMKEINQILMSLADLRVEIEKIQSGLKAVSENVEGNTKIIKAMELKSKDADKIVDYLKKLKDII